MSTTIQEYLAAATQKASTDLVAALLRIPDDKRNWSPEDKARTAVNQVAECALLNGYTADTIQTHQMAADSMQRFPTELAEAVALPLEQLQSLLQENTAKVSAAIQAVPDDALSVQVAMPWGPMTLEEIIPYPHWNMTYHQGQINYIASLLGVL